jgi:hypothetical protein
MSEPDTLMLYGQQLKPEGNPISLSKGWNLKSFLSHKQMPVDVALGSIAAALEFITNGTGEFYWPAYGIHTLEVMEPGHGYKYL